MFQTTNQKRHPKIASKFTKVPFKSRLLPCSTEFCLQVLYLRSGHRQLLGGTRGDQEKKTQMDFWGIFWGVLCGSLCYFCGI